MTSTRDREPPMLGLTHGNRSPVTCRLCCGDACAKPVPDTSENRHFRDIASMAPSRRALFGGAAAVGLAAGLPSVLGADPLASADRGRGAGLRFEPITPVTGTLDDVTVTRGYAWQPIIRWGDPVLRGARVRRIGADGVRPGGSVRLRLSRGDHTARSFDWNLLLICGDPATASTYFGGYTGPVSPIACPDNGVFDSTGTLWVSTDSQAGSIGYNDALHRVTLSGRERGKVEKFLSVPVGAATCGPVIHDKDGSVFVTVQPPGENGAWAEPLSYFPDYVMPGERGRRGDFSGPRPTVIQVTRH